MRRLLALVLAVAVFLLVVGCSEQAEQPTTATEPALPLPKFAKADDPKVLFANFLADLKGDQFFPQVLLTELEGSTDLARASRMIQRHHTVAFVEWYFSKAYLDKVWDVVETKLKRMDYQLKILDVTAEDAAEVLFVTYAGLMPQKTAFSQEGVAQQWQQAGDGSYQLLVTGNGWQQTLRVVREGDQWKLEIANF